MELLKFIFQSFWHFLGAWILVAVIMAGFASIIRAFRALPEDEQ